MNINGNWQIEQQCPQCGAPIILAETDFILSCQFCRTSVYLAAKDHYRYFIPPAREIKEEIFFLPYWRLKGLSYSLEDMNISSRFFDANLLALNASTLPRSLGLRPQVLKLKFVGSEVDGTFFAPNHDARNVLFCSPKTLDKGAAIQKIFIGETISIIYAPFYCAHGYIYDAVLEKKLLPPVPEEEIKKIPAAAQRWNLNFIPLLCPQCGADMPADKSSLVLFCSNCHTAWTSTGNGFEKINFSLSGESSSEACYLPFWRLKARIEGLQLDSYADLIRIANLPKAPSAKWENAPFYFWAPAFKINPAAFLRWCKQMTVTYREEEIKAVIPRQAIYPVTLPVTEAAESFLITLAGLTADKKRPRQLLSALKFTLEAALLVLEPFAVHKKELIHAKSGLGIDKTALNFGAYI